MPCPAGFLVLHCGPCLIVGDVDLGDVYKWNISQSETLELSECWWLREIAEWIWKTIGIEVVGVGKPHNIDVKSTISKLSSGIVKLVADVLESGQQLIPCKWEHKALALVEAAKAD